MKFAASLLCVCACLAADGPWRIARFDGASAHLADDLRAAAIDHLWAPPGTEPPGLPGITIIREKAQGLADLRPGSGRGPVVLTGGAWPGLRSSIVLDQQKDVGFAAATAEPWITENGWILLCSRGIVPEAQPVLAYDPPRDTLPKIGANALAVAEAAVFGGSYAIAASALAEGSTPRARADRRRTIAQLKFVESHAGWFSGLHYASVAVVADNPGPPAEVMNLLVRRNLPFQAFTRERWPAERPAVLVLVGQTALRAEDRARLDTWRAAGTVVFERGSPPNPSEFAAEVRQVLGDRRPFRLTNGQQVIALLTAGRERVLHLLNYGIDPIQDLRVQLANAATRARLFSPDEPDGKSLDIRQGEVTIPEMGSYCAVLFE